MKRGVDDHNVRSHSLSQYGMTGYLVRQVFGVTRAISTLDTEVDGTAYEANHEADKNSYVLNLSCRVVTMNVC